MQHFVIPRWLQRAGTSRWGGWIRFSKQVRMIQQFPPTGGCFPTFYLFLLLPLGPGQSIASSNEVTLNCSYCWEYANTGLNSRFQLLYLAMLGRFVEVRRGCSYYAITMSRSGFLSRICVEEPFYIGPLKLGIFCDCHALPTIT